MLKKANSVRRGGVPRRKFDNISDSGLESLNDFEDGNCFADIKSTEDC